MEISIPKSFETTYEVADTADCASVDCAVDSSNSCCTLTIEEEGDECQSSAIMLDPTIQGAQPIFSDDNLICSEIAEGNTSFQFDDIDEFLVLVPKLLHSGDNDSSCDSDGEYKDKQDVNGEWVDCEECEDGASTGSCDDCGCAIIEYLCDGSSGATEDENGMCVCEDGVSGCVVQYTETVVYNADQIDFADYEFEYDTVDFEIKDSAKDGVCSKFEYMVMTAFHNLENANDSSANANWTDEQMQKMALNAVQAGFIVDSADNNQNNGSDETDKNYQQIYATRYDGSNIQSAYLSDCGIDAANLCTLGSYDYNDAELTGTSSSCSGVNYKDENMNILQMNVILSEQIMKIV